MTVRNCNRATAAGWNCLIIGKLNAWSGCIVTCCLQLISSLIQHSACLTPRVLWSQTALAQLCTTSSPWSTPDYKIKSGLNPVRTTWGWEADILQRLCIIDYVEVLARRLYDVLWSHISYFLFFSALNVVKQTVIPSFRKDICICSVRLKEAWAVCLDVVQVTS